MDSTCLAILFKLVGNHHISAVNVVSHNVSSDDSTNDGSRMDANSHIKLVEIDFPPDGMNDIDHG